MWPSPVGRLPRFQPSLAVIPEEQPKNDRRWSDFAVRLLLRDGENREAMYRHETLAERVWWLRLFDES